MQLYLLRHGIAEDGQAGQQDSERALTPDGKRKLRGVLKTAREANVKPALIVTSPYLRAVQTAELAAEVLGYAGELIEIGALAPSARPEDAWEEIRLYKDEAQVLAAGHEPLFSALTAYLLRSPSLQVDFKKGALVRIDFDRIGADPRGILKWMLVPKLA
jgi:phosphohistidine phosphatase